MNKTILLIKRPVGKPTLADFKIISGDLPEPAAGEVLLKTLYVSVDPYLRGRMNDQKSYIPPFELSKPIQSAIVAEVMESNGNDLFKKGDCVTGHLQWSEFQISIGKGLIKVNSADAPLPAWLGVLGMTGLTAYLGLTEIGLPKAGETLVVSGAAGAVGTIVGQIGKRMGCKVVGITGSDKKATLLKSKFKYDEAINYKTCSDLASAIQQACPAGVDLYFDNVGGVISDGVYPNINKHARLIVCGAISTYNETKIPTGPRIETLLLTRSATMRGFIVSDFQNKFPEAIRQLAAWLKAGEITYADTLVNGFESIPQAFLDLFEGKNEGKMIVKV
jgi:NADPH-dependent curcumin reductase CurA